MEHPNYYRFAGGYKPVQADTFEEAKAKLMEKIKQEHALEIANLIETGEEPHRWSKCGCTGWHCRPDCPEYGVAF